MAKKAVPAGRLYRVQVPHPDVVKPASDLAISIVVGLLPFVMIPLRSWLKSDSRAQ